MIETLIDFGIYVALMLWAFIKCVAIGSMVGLPVFLVWCLCATSARADEAAQRIFEEHHKR